MPTVAEPLYPALKQRREQAVREFIEAKPRTISDSEYVLSARLFGTGMRGQDLSAEINLAKAARFERRRCPRTNKECPRGGGCADCTAGWSKTR